VKISTKARYGSRLMVNLGLRYGQGPVYLKEIARVENISEKYLSQIIIPLKHAGLVNSFRGSKGGYVLGRNPLKISMREIVTVLEGDFNLVKCVGNARMCSRVSVCVTRNLWAKLGNTMQKILDSVKLSDLIKECKTKKKTA